MDRYSQIAYNDHTKYGGIMIIPMTMNKYKLFPKIEPYKIQELPVSSLHSICYEEVGNPKGKPALFLHGGPGVGIIPDYRRFFDPDFYRIVLLDQRGAGRSKPYAEIAENTTWHLVEDIEKLRNHLGIDKWIIMGGSWGSTLALCYAISHPEKVAGLILRGVFLARPKEMEWLFMGGGAADIFPDHWEKFIKYLPEKKRKNPPAAYYEILVNGNEEKKLEAARFWNDWEMQIMTLLPPDKTENNTSRHAAVLSTARIECHYTVNRFFMKSDNFFLDHIHTIKDVPCRIIQGRYDIVCPVVSAMDLHKNLKNSQLSIVPDGSHSPMSDAMIHELVRASEDFKSNSVSE